jgi:hypothetical protein
MAYDCLKAVPWRVRLASIQYQTAPGPHYRKDALNWAQHCTEAGDANGK